MKCLLSEGAWENQGLGVVKRVGDELIWTYTASHLGHWIAAPLPSSESNGPLLYLTLLPPFHRSAFNVGL